MRTRTPLLTSWRFHRGDPLDWNPAGFANHKFDRVHLMKAANQGLAQPNTDLAHWRQVEIPHDFVIEGRYDPQESSDHACLAVGPAWYQRRFTVADKRPDERIVLHFEGVYRDAEVWVDGWYAGGQGSGYLGFRLDVTDLLEEGDVHAVAVRVDASGREGWWYEGGGIYRPVYLERHADRAFVADGVFARCAGTVQAGQPLTLLIDTEVRDWRGASVALSLHSALRDAAGRTVAETTTALHLESQATSTIAQTLTVIEPALWTPATPHLYTVISSLYEGTVLRDHLETTTGLRSMSCDGERGFLLNGEPIKLHGFCCHQDLAGVGVALTAPLHAWKLERLRWMGANAYRSAHHPPAPELLDAADRLGVIVMSEHRLPGFDADALGLLESLIRRDRSRACVGMWSLCNEEMDLQSRASGARLMQRMSAIVDRLDGSRPITAAVNFNPDGPLGKALPVLGFNYQQKDYDTWRAANPGRPAVGSETASTLATRGVHDVTATAWQGLLPWPLVIPAPPSANHARVLADGSTWPIWGDSAWACWEPIAARDWLAGTFVWTGFDYYGETIPLNAWPAISTNFGVLDLGGLPKDHAWYYRCSWRNEPEVRLGGHWSWTGREGESVPVRIYHNGDEVELWCNGRLLEKIPAAAEPPLRMIPYEPGWIEARTRRQGLVVATHRLVTAGPAAALQVQADRQQLAADGVDALVVHIAVVDATGTVVPNACDAVTVTTTGPIRLAGGHNGDPCDHAAPTDATRTAWAGWLTIVVRAGTTPGEACIRASAAGRADGILAIAVH